jgi:Zn-dependent peptidase ImmA (M78 family)
VAVARRALAEARFTIAHELARLLLHAPVDHFQQRVAAGAPRTDACWESEREANDCATEVLIAEQRSAPYCAVDRADVAHVDRLARSARRSR